MKNRTIQKIFALGLAAVLTASAAGCGTLGSGSAEQTQEETAEASGETGGSSRQEDGAAGRETEQTGQADKEAETDSSVDESLAQKAQDAQAEAAGPDAPAQGEPRQQPPDGNGAAQQTAAADISGLVYESEIDAEDQFTNRDLAGTWDEAEAVSITLSGSGLSADDSSVTVSDGIATITEAGVYVISGSAKDVQIKVDAGDEDKVQLVLSDVMITNTDTSAIFILNADKTFVTLAEGTDNTLSVTGAFVATEEANQDGVIFAKDDLVLNGTGSLSISSTDHGIVGKDDLKICGGTIEIAAEGKGIAANDSIRIADGEITIRSEDDAIHADSSDDEAGYVYISGGTLSLATGDDGIHADGELRIDGGTITVTDSYEGLEGANIIINDGEISVKASDDGLNAAGGNDGSGMTGGFGRDAFGGFGDTSAYSLTINGGTLSVNASGDGLDSNGNLIVTGGTVYVSGPTGNGDGAIDYGDGAQAVITGGVVIAVGSSGMAECFGSASTQCAFMANLNGSASGEITIRDGEGNELISYTPEKAYSNVVFSSPVLEVGETYTIEAGGVETEITLTDTITGASGGFGGMDGMGGKGGFGGFEGFGGFGGGGSRPGDEGIDTDDIPADGAPSEGGIPGSDGTTDGYGRPGGFGGPGGGGGFGGRGGQDRQGGQEMTPPSQSGSGTQTAPPELPEEEKAQTL